ncbi:hypothetical protein CLV51_104406 [Chitinophaga niastensis]|uniref:Patatin-like phospholipase n=1 Tax=Chitinophaga niastensis TaxID=536980 RepID=A0A2P8HHN3_CHINA|nr:hypothetical protein [Chitinophaga niastensis]PSL45699.1 hypothetical protein CLV51_104406 [Chitinophaga niastensis]
MQTKILDLLKSLFALLFFHFKVIFEKLSGAKDQIPLRYLVSDFFSVLRSCGMFSILNILAFFVFTMLPQGRDVLLIIVEEIAIQHRIGNLFWLLGGVFLWSVVSEYGSRYAIYVTDNSGKSLSEERVRWRKAVQETVANMFLLVPFLIVFASFLINYLRDNTLTTTQKNWGFGIPVACLYFVLNVLARAYFSGIPLKKKSVDSSLYEDSAGKETEYTATEKKPSGFMSFMQLLPAEQRWCNKLIGIYNEYLFTLRKPSSFSAQINKPIKEFAETFLKLDKEGQDRFLQQPENMTAETIVPDSFIPKVSSYNQNKNDELYKWVYEIPLSFYASLHKQLKVIVLTSIFIFTVICFLPVYAYEYIGAPGLVIIAFTCWSGMYIGLLYLDYAVLRKAKFSMRFFLTVLLIASSFLNNDHQVRYNEHGLVDRRPVLSNHFDKWFENYKGDSFHTRYQFKWIKDTKTRYPVIFVCAEGGALRTGAFAAQTLSFLEDNFVREKDSFIYKRAVENDKIALDNNQPATNVADYYQRKIAGKDIGSTFKKAVYAYSGVSGGALGLAFFNAIAYLTPDNKHKSDSLSQLTNTFFNQDYLSPVIGKMFYGDFLNLFIPFHIKRFDRAIALEQSWENGYLKTITTNATDIFSDDYLGQYDSTHIHPAMFVNTTEVESGLQCWLSNVKPDSGMYFGDERDLFLRKLKGGINYSTMVNFSSRFPLFSPAANVRQNENMKLHYIDGGYAENTGAGTMFEILQSLKARSSYFKNDEVVPFVFVLKFSDEKDDEFQNINLGNEVMEIVDGIYDTRAGRSTMAMEQLKRYTEQELHGRLITLSLSKSGSQVPLNWVLSATSLNNLKNDIEDKWKKREVNDLNKFFLLNAACVRLADTAKCAIIK